MAATIFQDIKGSLRQLYLEDKRPWLVGFSGGFGQDAALLSNLALDNPKRFRLT